jgi:hypothetical protein
MHLLLDLVTVLRGPLVSFSPWRLSCLYVGQSEQLERISFSMILLEASTRVVPFSEWRLVSYLRGQRERIVRLEAMGQICIVFLFFKKRSTNADAHIHLPYERTHPHPTPMSTSGRLSRRTGSWNWRRHHKRLAVDGNIASQGMNIPYLWDTHISNLEFELWWAEGTTNLLTTQPQVGSQICIVLCCSFFSRCFPLAFDVLYFQQKRK